MAPKVVDREKRKREIALLALEQFAERGFEASSMSQIASAVGVGKGTLYDYFASKEDLIYEAMVAWVAQMTEGVEQLIEGIEDPGLQLRTLARVSMELVEQDPRALQMMIAAIQVLLRSENLSKYHFVRDAFGRFRRDVVGILLAGVSRGVFRRELAEHAEAVAINLLAYLDGIGMHYYLSHGEIDVYAQMEQYLDQLFAAWRVEQEGA